MEKSSFFDSINGDRRYNSQDWADYFSCLINNGVLKTDDSLKAISNNKFEVVINKGKAWINGRYYENTDDYIVKLDPPDSVTLRIDRIVLRLDFINRSINLATLRGTPHQTTPTAPELTKQQDIFEIGIADIKINKGATNISSEDITDIREFAYLLGIDEVLQCVSNGKKLIAQAITDKGIGATHTDTFRELAAKIRDIQGHDAILAEPSWNIGVNTVSATLDTLNGFFIKFKIDQGQWQTNPTFNNLEGNTRYTFHAMLSNGASTKVLSTSPKANQNPPGAPTIVSMTKTSVTIQAPNECKIRYENNLYNSPYTFENLINKEYTFYSVKEATSNLNESVSTPLTHTPPSVYGIRINENNLDPNSCCEYIEDAIGINPATQINYGGWADKYPFNDIKPCGFKSGKVVKYINPNDFSKYIDGSSVGTDVDIMIEFPKLYWKFTKLDNGYEIRISKHKLDNNYICPAHTIGTKEVDNIYIGAYIGYYDGTRLRSMPNKKISDSYDTRFSEQRKRAQANGVGYQQFNYYSMLMLQILYLIAYKNLHSQDALGFGVTSGRTTINTGSTINKGMVYGATDNRQSVKFAGIEDIWGNASICVDGYYLNTSNKYIYISRNDVFNDDGKGYESCGKGCENNLDGYISKVQAGSKTGFLIKEANGNSTSNYCDEGYMADRPLLRFGGDATSYDGAGIFSTSFASVALSYVAARLVYLG